MKTNVERTRAALAAAILGLALASCSSPTGSDPSDPSAVVVSPATSTLVSIGDTVELAAVVRNASGQPLSPAVTWSASPAGIATVDGDGRVVATGNGVASITATAGSVAGSATVTVEQVVDSTSTSGGTQGGDVGAPLDSAVVVTLFDARGNPVAGAPVAFTVASGGGSVSPSESTTDAAGSAATTWTLGTDVGIQELDVLAGFSGEADLRLTASGYALEAASLVLASGDGQIELPSTALAEPLRVRALDALGNGVPDVLVTFEVDGDAVLEATEVTTDLDGVASVGLTLGTVVGSYAVTARAGVSDSTAVPDSTVSPDSTTVPDIPLAGSPLAIGAEAVPYVLSAVPGLTEGDTVTLTGSGFHPTLESNSVVVGGVSAAILGGSQTELTIEVPGFGCTPERGHDVIVSRTGHQATQPVAVTPSGALSLAVGERVVLSDASDFCLQLPPGDNDEYLVGLTSTSWFDGGASFSIEALDSTGPFPTPPAPASGASSTVARADAFGAGGFELRTSSLADPETRLRAWESELLSSSPALAESYASLAIEGPSTAPPLEGDQLQLRLPDLRGDACVDYVPVTAEVFSVGARLALATSAPLPGPLDPAMAVLLGAANTLHAAFGDTGIDLIMGLLGAPASWNADSRVTVVLTPEVSAMGLPVYASAVDQLPRATCPSSDEGHYVYATIPDAAAVADLAAALADSPPELAHQIAHVVQWTRRLAAGGNLLPSWIAEGQAELIVEHVGLVLAGLGSQQELGSDVLSIPGTSPWIPERFDRLALFQGWDGAAGQVSGAPEQCSLFGFGGGSSVCDPESGPGAAWAFLRYVSDRFAPGSVGGEPGLHQAIIDLEPTGDLVGQLEVMLGTTLPDLIADWAAALHTDGRLTPAQAPTLQLTSWDLTSMYAPGPKRLAPDAFGFSDFARAGTVVGGGTAYTLVTSTGAHGSLAISVGDGAGGAIPEVMRPRLWVVRMR